MLHGTGDDLPAALSWNAGQSLALGGSPTNTVRSLVRAIWPGADGKERALWPNARSADNETDDWFDIDYNYNFISPGLVQWGRGASPEPQE